ncbi:MAG: hypothetical protein IPI10_18755, partial [Bacteroidetes bacterium]|nr:hypothetical protein [Bacteroidota bacterium]
MKSTIIFILLFTSWQLGQGQNKSVSENSLVLVDTSKVIIDPNKRQPYKVSTQITSDNGTQISDSSVYVILDSSFQGTDEELTRKINNGELEQYLVKGKRETVRKNQVPVVVDNESFFEKHFIVICGLIVLGLFVCI